MTHQLFVLPAAATLSAALALGACSKGEDIVERGRYLVTIGGCNDCHTAGFAEKGLAVPEEERLMGAPIGYLGPWGTSYAANLRLSAGVMTEKDWVARMKGQGLPPMPWPAVNTMREEDMRAIYAYLKFLGEKGQAMPPALPPGAKPTTPYFEMVPKTP